MIKIILYLVRRRLGVKRCEVFQFVGQKTDAVYWINDYAVLKKLNGYITYSNVSLNWLLSDECKVTIVKED